MRENTITVAEAIAYATRAHAGQFDYGGRPYVEHVLGVHALTVAKLDSLGIEGDARLEVELAAIGHDLIEDTDVDDEALQAAGFPEGAVSRIVRLSGTGGVAYLENIRRMAAEGDLGVILVKLSDNQHNSLPERIAHLPPERRGVARRYEHSMKILREALDALAPASEPVSP